MPRYTMTCGRAVQPLCACSLAADFAYPAEQGAPQVFTLAATEEVPTPARPTAAAPAALSMVRRPICSVACMYRRRGDGGAITETGRALCW